MIFLIRLLVTLIFLGVIGVLIFRFISNADLPIPPIHELSIAGISHWVQTLLANVDIGAIVASITDFFKNNLGMLGMLLAVASIFILIEESS